MLEEALKNANHPPAETATAMLHFVQSELPSGGSQAEQRFFRLYGDLIDRIFGPLGEERERYHHREGGWLSRRERWSRTLPGSTPSSTMSRSTQGITTAVRTAVPLPDEDPVVKLLSVSKPAVNVSGGSDSGRPNDDFSSDRAPPPGTLLEAISKEAEINPGVRFTLPLHALPKPLQESWLALLDSYHHQQQQQQQPPSMMSNTKQTPHQPLPDCCTTNDVRLLTELLCNPPAEQAELQAYRHRRRQDNTNSNNHQARSPLQLSPHSFNNNNNNRSSSNSNSNSFGGSPTNAASSVQQMTKATPHVVLSMLEYYLFIFLRYPLHSIIVKSPAVTAGGPGVRTTSTATGVSHHHRRSRFMSSSHYGQKIYDYLLEKYIHYFLPHNVQGHRHMDFCSKNHRDSELFLRTLITLWLESPKMRLVPTPIVLSQQRAYNENGNRNSGTAMNLQDSYDLVENRTSSSSPYRRSPQPVLTGLIKLVRHVLIDPSLPQRVYQASNNSTTSGQNGQNISWCLNATQTALQMPLYNYIRATFRYVSLHDGDHRTAFDAVLKLWLMYLEPWNVKEETKRDFSPRKLPRRAVRKLIMPRYSDKSMYTPAWEAYIYANVHMYVVPLAIFLRRSRELDFSDYKFNSSISIVRLVFRVFTPRVVDVLNQALAATTTTTIAASISQQSNDLAYLARRHVQNLEPYCLPPSITGPALSLSDCENDMSALLEEIQTQRVKSFRHLDWISRAFVRLEELFSPVIMSEQKDVIQLVDRAKVIAGWPKDKDIALLGPVSGIASLDTNRSAEAQQGLLMMRTKEGVLTDYGREQLAAGKYQTRADQVHYQGDLMRARPQNYEFASLVELSVWMSDLVNEKFGWNETTIVRVNLRFMANGRMIAVALLAWFCRKLIVMITM